MVTNSPTTDRRLAVGMSARILYVNGDGRTSERTIDIISCSTSRYGVNYIRARCHLRNEERTFRTDRVLAVLESHGATPHEPATPWPTAGPKIQPVSRPCPAAARQPPTAARPATPRPRPSKTPQPRGHVFGKLAAGAAALLVAAWLWNLGEDSGARFVPPPTPIPRPAPGPAPQPDDVRIFEYRGQRIEARRTAGPADGSAAGRAAGRAAGQTTYTLLVSGRTYMSIHDARVAIGTSVFSARTGITDPDVVDLFAGADGNQDGVVSWEEVQRFQTALNRSYRYESNPTALRPNEFMAAGGGDCEDWALMTAGMLRFWGIPVFIGSLSSSTGSHAVALVPTTRIPPGAMTIDIPAGGTLRAGSYVPIDYDHVGRLSNAVARRFTVERIWVPEEIYGWSI